MSAPVSARPDFTRLAPAAGSRVVVVGGCGGIGRAVVSACLDCDLKTAVLDLPTSLAHFPVPNGVIGLSLDARDPKQIAQRFAELDARWGGLDSMIHLSGFSPHPTPLEDITPEIWDEVLEVNLRSLYLSARAALPMLRKAGGGSIVTTASGLAVNLEKGVSPYAASKAGIIALTKALAKENAPLIRANSVAPSPIDTAFLAGGTGRVPPNSPQSGFAEKIGLERILTTIPMGRIGVPDDVVGPILFLAGDASRYMTGQVLYVNGGRIMP
jgi:3-oxoacyl-[acyl-carrier protein] reductase